MKPILVVAPAWVGDMVMAQSLVARLRERFPETPVDMVAPPSTAALAGRMPGVRRYWTIPTAHGRFDLAVRRRMGLSLRPEDYGLAIVLPQSFKAALVPWFAGIPARRGYRGEMRFRILTEPRRLDRRRHARTVDKFVALAEDDGSVPTVTAPRLAADAAAGRRLAEHFGVPVIRPVIAFCPGAEYGPAKRWPARHFARLAAAAAEMGQQVVILGGPNDKAIGAEIVERAGHLPGGDPIDLTGRTTLLEAVDLIGQVDCVVTNDSGLMHVAAALGRPLVAIFGSSSAKVTPPLGPIQAIAEIDLACRPCFKRTCPLGHTDCLNQLVPEKVAGMLFPLMARLPDPVPDPALKA